jgi:two-component system chemotaxis response regulator CheY
METSVSPSTPNGSAARVLIVDDDPAIRLLCTINLEREGLVVLEAGDGATALARARSEKPDLVLTDVSMPDLDGFGLAEALRRDRRTRRIPLVFLSGDTNVANEARAEKLGALAYLTKPFDPLVLASRIGEALALAGKHERRGPPTLEPEPLRAA